MPIPLCPMLATWVYYVCTHLWWRSLCWCFSFLSPPGIPVITFSNASADLLCPSCILHFPAAVNIQIVDSLLLTVLVHSSLVCLGFFSAVGNYSQQLHLPFPGFCRARLCTGNCCKLGDSCQPFRPCLQRVHRSHVRCALVCCGKRPAVCLSVCLSVCLGRPKHTFQYTLSLQSVSECIVSCYCPSSVKWLCSTETSNSRFAQVIVNLYSALFSLTVEKCWVLFSCPLPWPCKKRSSQISRTLRA